jgi:hypothetical protein
MMSDQPLDLFGDSLPAKLTGSRLDACKVCGKGRHEVGPMFAGYPIMVWVCCDDCPNIAELNPGRARHERP